MPRKITSPNGGSTVYNYLRQYEGGTGAVTQAGGLAAFNGISASAIGQPNGIAGLDSSGKTPATSIPVDSVSVVSVSGPTSVGVTSVTTYTITNYNSFNSYTLSAITGTVSRNGDTITYTAPAGAGSGGFVLNGRTFQVTINSAKPNTPTIAAVDGPSGSTANISVTGSVFQMNSGSNTHASSDWQVATDNAFTNIITQSMTDTVNKTSWTSGSVALSSTFYVRGRYRDNQGNVSDWSNTVTVTTKASYLPSTEEAKITGSVVEDMRWLGYSVAVSDDGTRCVVGAPYAKDGGGGSSYGAAYIFKKTGGSWVEEIRITAPINVVNGRFGHAVAMNADGTKVAIGQPYGGTNTVVVYTFNGTNWIQENLFSSGGANIYGFSLAFNAAGTRLAIGSPGADDANGRVVVYEYTSGWSNSATIQPVLEAGAEFGTGVALTPDGTRLIIGAAVASITADDDSGRAFIYVRSGSNWVLEQAIQAAAPVNTGRFGWSVDISDSGDRVVVGSWNVTASGAPFYYINGAAYVFVRSGSTWTQEAFLRHGDQFKSTQQLGISVSIKGDGSAVAIGAPTNSGGRGSVYIYTRSGSSWNAVANKIIEGSDSSANVTDGFGGGVALTPSGSKLVVGSYQKASTGSVYAAAGAVYVYF